MKRKCIKYPIPHEFIKETGVVNNDVSVFVDVLNLNEIAEVISKRHKKFKMILYYVLSGKYKNDLYSFEKISEKAYNITAMKFKEGNNERIYCKEYFVKGKKVVMIISYLKKSQKITKKLKSLIENISDYEYEFPG